MLLNGGDVQVMPDGNYLVGTSAGGARVFTPDGTFVRQYGTGNCSSICLLPNNRLWAGNPGTLTMNGFDTDSGEQVGSFTMDQQTRPSYMNYYDSTNTVRRVSIATGTQAVGKIGTENRDSHLFSWSRAFADVNVGQMSPRIFDAKVGE
jgi:hypothetical protein